MYLTEYLKLRGVGANALTTPEAQLLGVDTTEKGWVERNAHVVVPDVLAAAIRQGAGKPELKALAASVLANKSRVTPVQRPVLPDPFLKHEALDRCHVLLSTLDEHLLQHPFVQQNGDMHRAVKSASEALGTAYKRNGDKNV